MSCEADEMRVITSVPGGHSTAARQFASRFHRGLITVATSSVVPLYHRVRLINTPHRVFIRGCLNWPATGPVCHFHQATR